MIIKQGTWSSMQSLSWRALHRKRNCKQSEKNSLIFEWKTLRKLWKPLMNEKKTVQSIFVICINYLCLTVSWDQAVIQPRFCAWGGAKTPLLKISCGWKTASSKQARPGTFLRLSLTFHVLCSADRTSGGITTYTQLSSQCLFWSPSLDPLCRWLSTKGLLTQFRACSCFSSVAANNDWRNLKANMQWMRLAKE